MKIWSPYRAVLLWLVVVACSSPLVYATPHPQQSRDESSSWPLRLHIRSDFDGDQVPDTAVVRRHGKHYTLSIHFTGKSLATFSSYYATEPVIGITSVDVDGDRDRDIVLLGLNPAAPAGLWMNEGPAEFRTEVPWLAAVVYQDSPYTINHGYSDSPYPDPGSLTEPGPDASVPEGLLLSFLNSETGISCLIRDVPLSGLCIRLPSRGPPLNF